jgi:hypothetical protein
LTTTTTGLRHFQDSLRHIAQDTHVIQGNVPHCRVSAEDIKAIANDIFKQYDGRGIIYKDLIKGKHKRVDTKKQAQKILRNHKDRGNLFTNSIRIKPQEYYQSKQDAEEAALKYNNNSLRHIHPTGVNTSNNPLYTPLTDTEIAIEERKVDSITEAIELIAKDHDGRLPVGLHNIRLTLQLPPELTSEVYHEHLSDIPPSSTREKSKRIAFKVDGFKVDVFFYPNKNAKTVIIVSCSNRPFPISLNSPERTTSDFTSFVAQIRGAICRRLSDGNGRIVPPVHNARCWRLASAEFNWDLTVTTMQYLGMDGLQITKVNDITQRIYRKRIEGKHVMRIEETVHSFPSAEEEKIGRAIDNSVGDSLVAAAKAVKKNLSMRVVVEGGF